LSESQIKPQVDQLATQFLHYTRNAGLSIAIVLRNPATDKLEAEIFNYGVASHQTERPITSDTIYEIGSLTKLFTGILLAQAVSDGKVKLDDPIQQYLPLDVHAPTYKDIPITLVELATHRSGLPRDPSKRYRPYPFSEAYTQQNLYTWLSGYRLTRAPGEEYEYSNAGFGLLGDILAGLAGEDYDQLELQDVSKPLGLIDTEGVLSSEQENRLAQGYSDPSSPSPYFPQSGGMAGAAYLHSTISDMTRFLIANMQPDSTPLSTALRLAQTYRAKADGVYKGMGLGWQISNPLQPDERLWKRGQTIGFTSYISLAKDGSSGFVLLTNGLSIESLAPAFLKLLGQTTN
jgi:CubicO group peptidase (beta-lactamase class C family)